jgi:hypothetical protein
MSSKVILQPDFTCKKHGDFRIRVNRPAEEVPKKSPCPECGKKSSPKKYPPLTPGGHGGTKFSQTWDEQANEARRTPYDQAKAQMKNNYNEQRDAGNHPSKPTEKGIQEAAKQIDRDNKGQVRPRRKR